MATSFSTGTPVDKILQDDKGLLVLVRCATGDIPSAVAGYSVGCILINTTSGAIYTNTGTASSCTFATV